MDCGGIKSQIPNCRLPHGRGVPFGYALVGVNKGGAGGNVGTVYLMQLPEPTTSTLSLLALAALAARRRRK